jgi:hypothetical protein
LSLLRESCGASAPEAFSRQVRSEARRSQKFAVWLRWLNPESLWNGLGRGRSARRWRGQSPSKRSDKLTETETAPRLGDARCRILSQPLLAPSFPAPCAALNPPTKRLGRCFTLAASLGSQQAVSCRALKDEASLYPEASTMTGCDTSQWEKISTFSVRAVPGKFPAELATGTSTLCQILNLWRVRAGRTCPNRRIQVGQDGDAGSHR